MRRSWTLMALVSAALTAASCGWYTNAPAAVRVISLEPASVNVKFSKDAPPDYTNPKVVLGVENGSIGTTFSGMTISYINFADNKPVGELASPGAFGTIRIEASTAKVTAGDRPAGTALEMTGGTSAPAVLPVVNEKVTGYAKTNTVGGLTAVIKLTGIDDARFPSALELYVPITFSMVP